MNRFRARLLVLLVVLAIAALASAGTASAGWTWDEGVAGYVWADDASSDSSF